MLACSEAHWLFGFARPRTYSNSYLSTTVSRGRKDDLDSDGQMLPRVESSSRWRSDLSSTLLQLAFLLLYGRGLSGWHRQIYRCPLCCSSLHCGHSHSPSQCTPTSSPASSCFIPLLTASKASVTLHPSCFWCAPPSFSWWSSSFQWWSRVFVLLCVYPLRYAHQKAKQRMELSSFSANLVFSLYVAWLMRLWLR